MTHFRLFSSNRLEVLAESLARALSMPPASPLDQEVIVVQSKGMERWVSMELARRHGICANCRFPFPMAFVYEIFQTVIPGLPEHTPYDPRITTWKIMKLLPSCITRPGFEKLGLYLGEDWPGLKSLQLSEGIANTFDQYMLFRPEMILRWEGGEEDHWQAVLWRELVKGQTAGRHHAALGKAFLEATGGPLEDISIFPERVSVFGISALPRFHMEMLGALSRFTQVNLFLMNPCREYWGDILSDWEMKRTIVRQGSGNPTPEELYLERGNSLLASMGRLSRDFFDLLNEFPCEEFPSFEDPGEYSLLSCLQSDILNLRDRPEKPDERKCIAADDTSIQIHSCHSSMREIEVLHDQLLHIFEDDPDIMPKDILVMTPDIEACAPYIQAVFDLPSHDPRRIPFTISDQSVRKESIIIDAFLAILDLHGSRFGASQVLAILESGAVQRKFDLSDRDLDLVRRWVRDTRIRWGIDGQSRGQTGLPAVPQNTWKAGLERLLLGYAMPGDDENIFSGILPYDQIEGGEALVLGRFLEFADRLFAHVTALGQRRTLHEWRQTLTELLECFFTADEDTEREIKAIRKTLNDLDEIHEETVFEGKIDINVIKWYLGRSLERESFGFGFITGGITFCAMLPMRSIPFKIICLVGMNGDAYPRQSNPLGFDLMARHPEPGDRSRRNDDRYLFLEALLSARKRLCISYVGQSIADNSSIPPSVLVSEFLDYIEEGFDTERNGHAAPKTSLRDRIVTPHRLQAFNPAYFKDVPPSDRLNQKLFSYSEENCRAADRLLEARDVPLPFISTGFPHPEEEWKRVNLLDLCRFFSNPAKFLLNGRLGIYLEERPSVLEDREAFAVKGLEKYHMEEEMVKRKLGEGNLKAFLSVVQASGRLPHGTVGECTFERMIQGVENFAEKTEPYVGENPLPPLEVDLHISGFRLAGQIDGIYGRRLAQYRYARLKSRDHLRLWIYHLALNSVMAGDYPLTSMLAGLHPGTREPEWTAWEYSPVDESKEILRKLLEIYWTGMIMPLHFFPGSSWIYAQEILKKKRSPEDALQSAHANWQGNGYTPGECEDAYYQLSFRETDPLDSDFQYMAEEVFGPMLAHQAELD